MILTKWSFSIIYFDFKYIFSTFALKDNRLQFFLFFPEQDCLSADRGDFKKLLRFSLFCFHAGLITESRKTSGNIINNN